MKAQSELTGDSKRQAETICPRSGGVTTWMSTASGMIDNGRKFAEIASSSILDVSVMPELTEALDAFRIPKEVNHRPADQQWSVCTP